VIHAWKKLKAVTKLKGKAVLPFNPFFPFPILSVSILSEMPRSNKCSICHEVGHRADNIKFHTPKVVVPKVVVPKVVVPKVVVPEQNVIEHVAVVHLDDIPAYAEPGAPPLLLKPEVKHLGVYSSMATILERVTSGELKEKRARDILIALINCL
jgi:hypothetical protein